MIKSRPNFALIAPGVGGGDFFARPGSHVIMLYSVISSFSALFIGFRGS